MISLEQFIENAQVEGICDEYRDTLLSCGSKKQLMDMALSAKGSDYLCDAIAKGWGISPQEICNRFSKYINGAYVFEGDYTSAMYCNYNGIIQCHTTLLVLIESNGVVKIPPRHICQIYLSGKCSIRVEGEGECIIVVYGNEDDIIVDKAHIKCKILHKKERDGN